MQQIQGLELDVALSAARQVLNTFSMHLLSTVGWVQLLLTARAKADIRRALVESEDANAVLAEREQVQRWLHCFSCLLI